MYKRQVPKRGIGDRAEAAVEQLAERERITFDEALHRAGEAPGLATRSLNAITAFVKMMDALRTLSESGADAPTVLQAVLEQTGYVSELQQSADPQDETRIENLAELESVAQEFAVAQEESTLVEFLEQIALVADSDEIPDDNAHGGVVTLMTLHTAKGLEFPVVFLTGMEDGIFPHIRSLGGSWRAGRGASAGLRRAHSGPAAPLPDARGESIGVGNAGVQPGLTVP